MISNCPYCASFANACNEVAGVLATHGLDDGVVKRTGMVGDRIR